MTSRQKVQRFLSTLANAWMRGLISSGVPACANAVPPELRGAPATGRTG